MRVALLVLILVIAAILVAVATGFLDINQIRGARAPEISTTANGVTAKGGQTPAFDVQTGSVELGTANATVKVPRVEIKRAEEEAAREQAANKAANAM
jgi:hypothetical protein